MSEHYYTGAPTSRHDIRRLSICVEGRTLDFDTDAGVFSRGELDAGTELMIRSLPPLAGRVLDLGCGWGALGLFIKARCPKIELVCADINERAAAQRIHHAERSGLLHHTLTMLKCADALLPIYPFLDGDLLRAGVILHDLSKTEELSSDNMGLVSGYTRSGQLVGHLVQGAIAIDRAARRVGASDETRDMLEHMLLSHHELPEYGSPRPPMFPEAETLSLLHRMDARMYEMSHTIACVSAGEFTDKVWSLDRRLYRREERAEGEAETKQGE